MITVIRTRVLLLNILNVACTLNVISLSVFYIDLIFYVRTSGLKKKQDKTLEHMILSLINVENNTDNAVF